MNRLTADLNIKFQALAHDLEREVVRLLEPELAKSTPIEVLGQACLAATFSLLAKRVQGDSKAFNFLVNKVFQTLDAEYLLALAREQHTITLAQEEKQGATLQ